MQPLAFSDTEKNEDVQKPRNSPLHRLTNSPSLTAWQGMLTLDGQHSDTTMGRAISQTVDRRKMVKFGDVALSEKWKFPKKMYFSRNICNSAVLTF